MGNEKKTPIKVDEVEYFYEDMTQEQQNLVNHIEDLARKINSSQFNLDQLKVGQQAFVNLLKESLTANIALQKNPVVESGTPWAS
jgi:hypothetical protein